jgi:hypothetical protein
MCQHWMVLWILLGCAELDGGKRLLWFPKSGYLHGDSKSLSCEIGLLLDRNLSHRAVRAGRQADLAGAAAFDIQVGRLTGVRLHDRSRPASLHDRAALAGPAGIQVNVNGYESGHLILLDAEAPQKLLSRLSTVLITSF